MRRSWPLALIVLPVVAWLFHRDVSPAAVPGVPASLERPAETTPPVPAERSEEAARAGAHPPEPEESVVQDHSWRRSSSLRSLLWLARHQNEDGSWGEGPAVMGDQTIGRTGITAMALLSYLGGGYSQLSKDQYDEQEFGPIVLRGLKWLLHDQQENGSFRSVQGGALDQAIASYALLEAYGMTASQPLKDPSQQALDAMIRLQKPDGSWGGEGPSTWALWSLLSAESNEQPFPPDVKALAAHYAAASKDLGVADTRMIWTKKRTPEDRAQILAIGTPLALNFEHLYYGTSAAFYCDGPDGPVWKQWNDGMLAAVLQSQGADGSWEAGSRSQTVVRSSLALRTLQVFYVRR